MDSLTNRAVMIGVGLFITIMITSGIIYAFQQFTRVYKEVYETDINLHSDFGEFDAFNNTVKTGLDFINACKKYQNDPLVTIKLRGGVVDKKNWKNYQSSIQYEKRFNVTMEQNAKEGTTTISFN